MLLAEIDRRSAERDDSNVPMRDRLIAARFVSEMLEELDRRAEREWSNRIESERRS